MPSGASPNRCTEPGRHLPKHCPIANDLCHRDGSRGAMVTSRFAAQWRGASRQMRKSAAAGVGATAKVASRARRDTATAVVGDTAKVASRARRDTATAVVGDTAKKASRARRDMASEVQVVPLTRIVASARNPRRKRRNIEELAASMQAYGLLQPIVVRPQGGQFEVIAGHRRLEAAQLL